MIDGKIEKELDCLINTLSEKLLEEDFGRVELDEYDIKYINIAMSQEFLVVLAKNKYLQPFINSKFESNYSKYYEAYIKEGKDVFGRRKNMLDIVTQDTLNKLLGIVLADVEDFSTFDKDDFRLELIKRGYKDLYRQIKSSSRLNMNKIFEWYCKKQKKNKLGKREIADIAIISNAIAVAERLEIDVIDYKVISKCCEMSMDAEMRYEKFYTKDGRYNRLFDIIPKDLLNTKSNDKLLDVITDISSDSIKDEIMADAMQYYIAYLESIGLDIETFSENLTYDKEDVNTVTTFLNNDKNYILTNDSKKAIFSALLIFLVLKKRYEEARNVIINTNAENRFKDALLYKENIEKKESELDKKINSYEQKIYSLKKDISSKDEEILELKKQLKKQQDIINKNKDNSMELMSLRKAIYSINNDLALSSENSDNSFEKKISLMKENIINEKIVVFGGNPKWINSLKEELPTYIYFGAEDINRDLSCIKKCKKVYINTQVLSHAFYYKIVSEASKNNVDIEYILKSDKNAVIEQIYNDIAINQNRASLN